MGIPRANPQGEVDTREGYQERPITYCIMPAMSYTGGMTLIPSPSSSDLALRSAVNPVKVMQGFAVTKRNPNTQQAYLADLRDYFAWCEHMEIEPMGADRNVVSAYAQHLELDDCPCRMCVATSRRQAYKPATVNRRLSTLTAFYEYAIDMELIVRNPARRVERPKVSTESQTLGVSARGVAAMRACAAERGLVAQALIDLCALSSLRISEALGIQVGTIVETDTPEGVQWQVPVKRKGRANTELVNVPLAETVQVLLTLSGDRTSGPVILNGRGNPMSRQQASAIVSSVAKRSGVAGVITAHSLRHSFVTLALDAGRSVRDVAREAGHQNTDTTDRYDRARHVRDNSVTRDVARLVLSA